MPLSATIYHLNLLRKGVSLMKLWLKSLYVFVGVFVFVAIVLLVKNVDLITLAIAILILLSPVFGNQVLIAWRKRVQK